MLSINGYGHDSGFSTGQRETLDDIVSLDLPDEHEVLVMIIGRADWIRIVFYCMIHVEDDTWMGTEIKDASCVETPIVLKEIVSRSGL